MPKKKRKHAGAGQHRNHAPAAASAASETSKSVDVAAIQCTALLDAFADFANANMPPSKVIPIDIFIETDCDQLQFALSSPAECGTEDTQQMWKIRAFFAGCMKHKNCSIRIHWSDVKWLCPQTTYNMFEATEFMRNPVHEDVHFRNGTLLGEVKQAIQAVAEFTKWTDWLEEERTFLVFSGFRGSPLMFRMRRMMMDIYATARLVKIPTAVNPEDAARARIHHLVYYAGSDHTQFAEKILARVGFEKIQSTASENPCEHGGFVTRQTKPGVVWPRTFTYPPTVQTVQSGEVFRKRCHKHFHTKNLVGVTHRAMWHNKVTQQTVYFIGESHIAECEADRETLQLRHIVAAAKVQPTPPRVIALKAAESAETADFAEPVVEGGAIRRRSTRGKRVSRSRKQGSQHAVVADAFAHRTSPHHGGPRGSHPYRPHRFISTKHVSRRPPVVRR